MTRIFVDYNTMNQDIWSKERRVLVGRSTEFPMTSVGSRVLLTDHEMEVEATLEFDRKHDAWWARPDWSTCRDLVDVSTLPDVSTLTSGRCQADMWR